VAQQTGVDFLNLQNALAGHEVCAKADHRAAPSFSHKANKATNGAEMEWFRFVTFGIGKLGNIKLPQISQGVASESLHPNYYGQLALGKCLNDFWYYLQKTKALPTSAQCTSTPGKGPEAERVLPAPF
jgi:hypothetical protein